MQLCSCARHLNFDPENSTALLMCICLTGAGGLAFLIGTGLLAGAVHISMLFLGRVFLGIGVGFANQVSS